MDKFTEAEILGTCNALGSEVRGVYQKGTDCLECLRDLLQYLRKQDENHSVLRFLGSNHLVETDLLPLLKRYKDEKEIFDFALRLLVALTSPAILLFNEEIPDDKVSHNVYLELVNYLQNYKKAFFEIDIWKVLYEHLEKRISLRPIERSEDDNLFIERILVVIRNILHIPTDELTSIQTDDNLSPQDKILWNLHLSKIDVIILYLCANEDEYKYCLHIVEILSLMLREHSPEILATTNEIRSSTEKEKDLQDLMAMRQREQNVKLKKVQTVMSSRFNGVYRVKNMKSISDNDYISHKLITDLNDVKFDAQKSAKRKPKNRLPLKDIDITRRSTLNIRLFLKNFCKEFLQTYNKLLAAIKRELLRKVSADHDDTYYLWAIEYFMKFNRLYNFQPALVTETISLQMFHHIQTQITNYHEMMLTEKSKSKIWSKRMRLGVSAYKELLETVFTMTKSTDINIQQNADNIVSSVFYVVEYREMLFTLLSHFDEVKFSLTYLSELVESVYMFLKMLENHSKRHSEIIVQKRKRKVKKRKKKPVVVPGQSDSNENLEEQWADIASGLSAAVQGRRNISSDTSPFDGASEVPFEEQKVDAVYKIREALLSKDVEQAVGMLRSARELWPEGDSFGVADIDSEDEFEVLREIYMSNLENPQPQNNTVAAEEPEEETDEEAQSMPAVVEQKLEIKDIYKKFASPKVVMPCCLLFTNYQTNTSRTNACLIKLLHKIAWECKMYVLFFQSTVFVTFQRIFQDPDVSHNSVIKEFYRFAKFIVSKFFEIAQKNDKVFVELLFWKGPREAYEVEYGYETYGTSESSAVKGAWTLDEEEELKYLYEENKDIYIEGQDVADIILANMDNKKRTKHQVILALKRLGLIQKAIDLKPHLRTEWKEEEVDELQHLFEDFKASNDVMGNILNGLSIKRSRKAVIEKMLELNFIQDRKDVLKRRSKKSKQTDGSDSDSDLNDYNSDLENPAVTEEKQSSNQNERGASSDSEVEANFFKNLETERLKGHDSANQNIDHHENSVLQKEKYPEQNSDNQIPNKKPPKIWEEQEIMELTGLFMENQGAEDIMGIILNSLSVKRSKQSVVEKLLEVGLIKDKKDVRKKRSKLSSQSSIVVKKDSDVENETSETESIQSSSLFNSSSWAKNILKKNKKVNQILSDSSDDEVQVSNTENYENLHISNASDKMKKSKKVASKTIEQKIRKRAPKIWDEQEIIELQQLYEKNKDSNDIVGNIINNQTVKRPKGNIIEKLLEVGLIKDKKEVRKKRTLKADSPLLNKETTKTGNISTKKSIKKNKKVRSQSLSSEDETLPLTALLNSGTKDDDSRTTKAMRKKAVRSLMSESSDDDLLLSDIQNHVTDNHHNNSEEATFASNKIFDDLKDSQGELPSIITARNDSEKRKTNRILSDSSDDETVPLHLESVLNPIVTKAISNEGSIHSEVSEMSDDSSKTGGRALPEDPLLSSKLAENHIEPQQTKLFSIPENNILCTKDSARDGNVTFPSQKRKRCQIRDSDSEDETIPINHDSLSSLQARQSIIQGVNFYTNSLNSDAFDETVQLPVVKKRARIVIESDESD